MTNKTASQGKISEFNFIDKYLRPLASRNSAGLNLADDVAIPTIEGKDSKMVVSKDIFVQNVHFLATDQPKDIASRLILSNISDIASSGALPKYYMLGLPKRDDLMKGFYDEFCSELAKVQDLFDISLIGGDTVSAKNDLFFSVTIFGEAPSGEILRRNAAKIDDDIYVTGLLGDAAAAVPIVTGELQVSSERFDCFYDRYWRPQPRLIAGMALKRVVHAMMDISDGLAQDIQHILKASGVGANIDASRVPISAELQRWQPESALILALTGGDDYELCFTASKEQAAEIALITQTLSLPCSKVGEIVAEGFSIQGYDGELTGWQHF